MRKILSVCLLSLGVFLFSCQQELTDILNQTQNCKITTSYYLGGTGMNDSANYEYDLSGRISKITDEEGYYTYQYSGNNISVRRYFDITTNELLKIDSVSYNLNNAITEFMQHDFSGFWGPDTTSQKIIFEYTGTQLTHLKIIDYYNSFSGPMIDSIFARYTWSNTGNMEKMVYYDDMFGPYDSILYNFDANTNYFKVAGPHFFLFDPNFSLYAGLEVHFPFYYSKNNVTDTDNYSSGLMNHMDYSIDSLNNLTTVSMGGDEYAKYKYSCQ